MTPKEETRIRRAMQDKIMHFAPTISPAPKKGQEIESIASAISMYAAEGVDRVIIQPKYMGSYCDIYLHKEIEQTRFFSRNGYPISEKRIPKDMLINAVKDLHSRFEWDEVTVRIIQSELLPWAALGKGLIVRDFGGYGVCHQSHCDYLRDSGMMAAISRLANTPGFKSYLRDAAVLGKKQLLAKYKQHEVRQYDALRFMRMPNVTEYQRAITLFHEQLDIYGEDDGSVSFSPFNILKTVFDDGTELINQSNVTGFRTTSDDRHLVLDLKLGDDGIKVDEETILQAYAFFNELTDDNMEGVVIKPDEVWNEKRVPMFKVRNNNYLQMIYGIRFQDDYEHYLSKRKVGKKMRCSRNQWNIAQSILKIPMDEIGPGNEEYFELLRKRILEEDFESKLDGRL
jgi:hypothetical protein